MTHKDSQQHIPDVYESVVKLVPITTLAKKQYCVIINPHDTAGKGEPQWGKRELRVGEQSFFLKPQEVLEDDKIKVQDGQRHASFLSFVRARLRALA